LASLSPEEFEDLVFLLARIDDESVVPVRNKDRGLDARLPDPLQRTLRGWQAKRYEKGKINWSECRQSVNDAVAFWRPPRITFVFAHELSAKEQNAFRTELVERVDLPVMLDFMPEAEVQRRLRDTAEGRQAAAWLFEGSQLEGEAIRRALAMGGELRDGNHAVERLGEIQGHLDRDPHLSYTTITNSAGAPETPSAEGTAISVMTQEGAHEVRLDAREKFPGALDQLGLKGAFVFTEDEAGEKARRDLQEAFESGREVSIESGIGIQVANVPVGLRGLMPDEPVYGQVSLIKTEAKSRQEELRVIGIVVVGDHELGMSFAPLDPAATGWEITLGGAAGGLEIFHSMRRSADGSCEHNLDWRHTFGDGSAVEQLLACRVLRSALEGGQVRLLNPADRSQVWLLAPLEGDFTEDIGDLERREQILEASAAIEVWTGVPLEVPARPSEDELRTLFEEAGRIGSPTIEGQWDGFDMTPAGEIPDAPVEVVVLEARESTIFGERLFLGIELVDLVAARATSTKDGARLEPIDDDRRMAAHLHLPSAYPAAAARPPGQDSGSRVLIRPLVSDEAGSGPETKR
jgi:hypothetical protein